MTQCALSPKQRIFIKEYLVDKNASRAYRAAYGDTKTAPQAASRLLKNVKVAQAVERGLAKQEIEIGITAEQNLREIARIAYYSPTVKTGDRLRAMELIGKHFGSFKERIETTTGSNVQVVLTMPANGSEVGS